MSKITDEELIDELQTRCIRYKKSLEEQKKILMQLEFVNEKLINSEQAKSQFLSNIRNEINNPLTSILGISDNIFSSGNPNIEKIRSDARLIYFEAFNLDFQLRNIFMAAEIEAGKLVVQTAKIEINEFIKNLVDFYRHLLEKKGINVEFTPISYKEKNYFYTDPEKLNYIISNILHNAIKFSNAANKLIIKTWLKDGALNIAVQDFGLGINNGDKEAIFDRFKQLDSGSTKQYTGHGLGLSITKALLEFIGGNITLDGSEKTGSIFTVSIKEEARKENFGDFSTNGNEVIFDEGEVF